VTDCLLLDTHITFWLDTGDTRLSVRTRDRIDGVWRQGGKVIVSAVTAMEISQLASKGRLRLDVPPDAWIRRLLGLVGFEGAAITPEIAARAYMLSDLAHGDPADRMLIATAIDLGCPLITYDERIIAFATSHGSRYGFTVES
jgi:PIN domain nuclease of toxin-antitoxin system